MGNLCVYGSSDRYIEEPYKKMTKEKSNPNTEGKKTQDDEVKKVAKSLGVDLDNDNGGKKEKESDSKKTDTEVAKEEGRSDDSGKSDAVDYKEKYAASTKEFQEKYKPMEDLVNKLKESSGKSLEDFVKAFSETGKKDDDQAGKDTSKDKDNEVAQKILSLEKDVSSLKGQSQVMAKEKVDAFRGKYELSEEDYKAKVQPLLTGVKDMKKPNGDSYTLEEALEVAYIVANKDNIDKMVELKAKIKQK